MDKRIFLPEGNGSKLLSRLSISRSQMDLALSGTKRGVKNYDTIREVAKNDFNGMYKMNINGNEIYLNCQAADYFISKTHEDYLAISEHLEMLSKLIKETKVKFMVCA